MYLMWIGRTGVKIKFIFHYNTRLYLCYKNVNFVFVTFTLYSSRVSLYWCIMGMKNLICYGKGRPWIEGVLKTWYWAQSLVVRERE